MYLIDFDDYEFTETQIRKKIKILIKTVIEILITFLYVN